MMGLLDGDPRDFSHVHGRELGLVGPERLSVFFLFLGHYFRVTVISFADQRALIDFLMSDEFRIKAKTSNKPFCNKCSLLKK
jgi:hypothetical protein